MRWALYVPVAALALLAGLYAWMWLALAADVERGAADLQADAAGRGITLAWDDLAVSGFPFRFEVTLAGPRIETPDGIWASDVLVGNVLPYDPGHVILRFGAAQRLTFRDAGGRAVEAVLQTGSARASLIFSGGALTRFDADLREVSGRATRADGGWTAAAAARLQLHLRQGDAGLDVAAKAEAVELNEGFDPALGPEIALARLEAGLPGLPPLEMLNLDRLRLWAETGGRVAVRELGLNWGEAAVSGSAELGLDARRRPEGRIDAVVGGQRALVAALGEAGLIRPDDMGLVLQALNAMALGRADGRSAVPLRLSDGRARIGPVQVGRLKPLY